MDYMKGDFDMKRIFSIFLVALMFSVLAIPASAIDSCKNDEVFHTIVSAEIQDEIIEAEKILDGPCKLAEEKIKEDGEYVVVNRFYTLEEMQERINAREVGGVSTATWYKRGASNWTYKAQLGVWFDYDGTEAHPTENRFTVVDSAYDKVGYTVECTSISGKNAGLSAYYVITKGNLEGALMVSCTKDGDIGYRDRDLYFG